MPFKKGHKTNLGKHWKLSKKARENISKAQKGKKLSKQHKKNIRQALKGREILWKDKISKSNTGKKRTKKQIKRMSQLLKGRTAWNKGLSSPFKGQKRSDEVKEKIKKGIAKHYDKVGRKTPASELKRKSSKWAEWRKAVFERDNYTCQDCGQVGGILHPHHKKQVALHPELIYVVSNGETLCKDCHRKTDSWGKRPTL